MIEKLLYETRLTLTQLAREQNVSVPTVWRWTKRGVRGHVLASFSCGGRKYTSREAFQRWIAALNGERNRIETPLQRKLRIESAERRADELGI